MWYPQQLRWMSQALTPSDASQNKLRKQVNITLCFQSCVCWRRLTMNKSITATGSNFSGLQINQSSSMYLHIAIIYSRSEDEVPGQSKPVSLSPKQKSPPLLWLSSSVFLILSKPVQGAKLDRSFALFIFGHLSP